MPERKPHIKMLYIVVKCVFAKAGIMSKYLFGVLFFTLPWCIFAYRSTLTAQVRVMKKIVWEKHFKLILIPNAIDMFFL